MNAMNPQPIPIRPKQPQTPDEQARAAAKKKAARAEFRKDALFIAGSLLCTAGAGMVRIWLGFLTAGFFCLLTPSLDLAIGFIRGLRAARAAQPRRLNAFQAGSGIGDCQNS